jgi:hypothetical protein
MRSYSDVESFISDYLSHDFGKADVKVPTDIAEVTVVTCAVMRNLSSTAKPVGRSTVYFPSTLGIQFSYGLMDAQGNTNFSGAALPIGLFENGDGTIAPIKVDENFLLGPEGVHLNVSGISGLASKTSAVEFGLQSVLTHTSKKAAVVMFNVKSKDLLYIDKPNPLLQEQTELAQWSVQAYEALGIAPQPFSDARFFAPSDPDIPGNTQSLRSSDVSRFEWDLGMIYQDVPTLFNPVDWDERSEGAWFVVQEEIETKPLVSYSHMLTWLDNLIQHAPSSGWVRGSHIATWNKLRMHLRRFPKSYRGLISTAGKGQEIPWQELNDKSVFFLDI